jgi:hypothetical protein
MGAPCISSDISAEVRTDGSQGANGATELDVVSDGSGLFPRFVRRQTGGFAPLDAATDCEQIIDPKGHPPSVFAPFVLVGEGEQFAGGRVVRCQEATSALG